MPRGYVLPDYHPEMSYEAFRNAFEWDVPKEYNIATESLDHADGVRTGTALYHVDETGTHHRFTYEALDRASDALAATLSDRGVTSGSHVAVCFPQGPELLLSHLAVYKLGAVTVPVSVLLGRESLTYTLEHSGADILLIDAEVWDDYTVNDDDTDKSTDVPDGRSNVFHNGAADPNVRDPFDPVDQVVSVPLNPSNYDKDAGHLGGFERVVGDWGNVPSVETSPDDPALLLYTSGTSGRPKGVLHGHRYLLGSLPGYHLWFQLFDPETFPDQRIWTPSEWAWAGALFDVVFPTLAIGGTVVSRVRRSKFDPKEALELFDDTGVTRAFLPPTALSLIRKAVPRPDTELQTLEAVQSGGEQLTPAVQEWAEGTFDLLINEGYGQTEANALAGNCRALFEKRSGSMGRPYPGHDVRILDENGEQLPAGEVGELAVEEPDPVFFIEYWEDPEATAAKFTDDGLLRTGDLAKADEDGYLWFRGREDDLIISSGYRVSPVEVEEALERDDRVQEAIVVGVPDAERGNRIKAHLLPAGDPNELTDADLEALRVRVRDEVGAHKSPHEFEVLADLPQTRSGKVDRSELF